MHSAKVSEISVMLRGKTILVEYRYLEGKRDRIPSLVAELVQLKVDVFVTPSFPSDPRRQASDQDNPDCHCLSEGLFQEGVGFFP
jgi:hypothetical protein